MEFDLSGIVDVHTEVFENGMSVTLTIFGKDYKYALFTLPIDGGVKYEISEPEIDMQEIESNLDEDITGDITIECIGGLIRDTKCAMLAEYMGDYEGATIQ